MKRKESRLRSRFPAFLAMAACSLLIGFGNAAVPAGAQDFGFGAADSTTADAASGISTDGLASFRLRAYVDTSDPAASALEARPSARLDFSWKSASAEAHMDLNLDPAAIATHPASILDQAWLAAYAGAFELKAGLFRTRWGKGDSLHVLDVIDPDDYTDFVNSDQKYAKLAQPTIKIDLRTSDNGKLEIVYLPIFRGNAIPMYGRWVPASLVTLATVLAQPPYNATDPLSATLVFPGTDSLKWGQAGARLTDSYGGIDLGLQYYYGFLRDPVIDMHPVNFVMNAKKIHVGYDRFHQVGADAAFVLAGFNFRAEVALDLTADAAGNDYLVHNRSLGWTAGVDREILGFGVNLQTLGRWILNHDGIILPYDIQAGSSECTNLLALNVSRSFLNEALALEATGVWMVGSGEFMIKPKATYTFTGELAVSVEGSWYDGKPTGQFGQYKANRYIELAFSLPF